MIFPAHHWMLGPGIVVHLRQGLDYHHPAHLFHHPRPPSLPAHRHHHQHEYLFAGLHLHLLRYLPHHLRDQQRYLLPQRSFFLRHHLQEPHPPPPYFHRRLFHFRLHCLGPNHHLSSYPHHFRPRVQVLLHCPEHLRFHFCLHICLQYRHLLLHHVSLLDDLYHFLQRRLVSLSRGHAPLDFLRLLNHRHLCPRYRRHPRHHP
mmetsp:Transcript_3878/g.5961  ORF Transcript_3878/g.5961 Transcript_3878/m.5961 type:complete len:203 (+) Transcript_3878:1809-2417(+)